MLHDKKYRIELISGLFRCREMHGYGDDNADVALASDDENEKVHAHIYWTKGWCIPEVLLVQMVSSKLSMSRKVLCLVMIYMLLLLLWMSM